MSTLSVYDGPATNVAVYNTYTDGHRLHFDVFIPTQATEVFQVTSTLDQEALAHAETFLSMIGEAGKPVQISMCSRCHINNTGKFVGKLWTLPNTSATIWPLEGCPKPSV